MPVRCDGVSLRWIEKRFEHFMAVCKDAREIRRHQKLLHEAAAQRRILDIVANQRSTVFVGKGMLVHPQE